MVTNTTRDFLHLARVREERMRWNSIILLPEGKGNYILMFAKSFFICS